jgi:methionyl-tRNA formyltransferase
VSGGNATGDARVGEHPARVVFFGSGPFAVPILEALLALPAVLVVGVISAPDAPSGRAHVPTPTAVTTLARRLGLPLRQPIRLRDPAALAAVVALGPDLGVLADYGRIVPSSILDLPEHGMLNVHPSALPRHRGATPIAATILAGDPSAGVTVILMDEGVDTGPVLAQEIWPLQGRETSAALERDAAIRGAALIGRVLPDWLVGALAPTPQDERRATLTRPLRREDGRLDPERTADELERAVRAFQPWPGTFVETERGRLGVLWGSVAPASPTDAPGLLVREGDRLALVTVAGRLVLERVQPAGGRPMSGEAYLRGAGRTLPGTAVRSGAASRPGRPGTGR